MMSDDSICQMMSAYVYTLYPMGPHLTAAYKLRHILRQLTKKVILSSRQTSDKSAKMCQPWRLFWLVPWKYHAMEGPCIDVPNPKIHSAFEKNGLQRLSVNTIRAVRCQLLASMVTNHS